MTLEELTAQLREEEQRAEDEDATVKLAPVLRRLVGYLDLVDGQGMPPTMADCNTAAFRLGVTPTTVARWAKAGRFDGAVKTSGKAGEWRIPLASVTLVRAQPKTTKKLWRPES